MHYFKLIKANNEADADLLASMHKLRWDVFHKELNWSVGLKTHNCMEFDEYDADGVLYIVRINGKNKVDAMCRLMPTTMPYMLEEHYSHFVSYEPVPKDATVWEISRTCASQEARKNSNGTATAQIIAAAIEFGLANNIKQYVSLTTATVYSVLRRYVGWDSTPLGEKLATADDVSYSLKHTVSQEMLDRICQKNNFLTPFLFDFDENLTYETLNDNSFVRENQAEAV